MDVAIVILNWNGKILLEKYLPSVVTHSEKAKIYVADNASTDDSLVFLAKKYPEIVIIKNEINFGFAGGYNKALSFVEEEIYILLNNDVEVTHGWLAPIINLFKTNESVAAIQPKIKSIQNPNFFDYAGAAGGFIDALGYPFCRGRIFDHIEEDTGQYDTDLEIFWASGACFAIRKECYKQAGGFDESYFAHQEEIDLCWRLKNLGHTIWYVHQSEVYHQGGGTLNSSSPRKTLLNFRNSLCTILKNYNTSPLPVLLARMLLDGVAAIRFLILGKFSHFMAILKAHLGFYSLIIEMFGKRKKLKKISHKFAIKSIVWHNFVLKENQYTKLTFDRKNNC